MLRHLLRQLIGAKRTPGGSSFDPSAKMRHAIELQARGQWQEAEAALQAARDLQPDNPDIPHLLANNLIGQGRNQEAKHLLEQVIEMQPNRLEAHFHLAKVHAMLGHPDLAGLHYARTLEIKPDFVEAMNNLANVEKAAGKIESAERRFKRALEINPDFAEAAYNLGRLLHEEGRIPEALHYHKRAFTAKPSLIDAHTNYIYWLNFDPAYSAIEIFKAHLQWACTHAEPLKPTRLIHANSADSTRKLRIGYVSPNFKDHAAAYFFVATLEHHACDEIHAICYSDTTQAVDFTQRIRSSAAEWRESAQLNDAEFAELIRRDQVDILVDLSGHTDGNRLLAFARKPAPLQLTWNGYANTTGMTAMDYRITDDCADPPGLTEHLHTEKLLRMPDIYMAFEPPAAGPDINELPALQAGRITFGSFNAITKISSVVVKTWSRILESLPDADLLVATLPSELAKNRLLAAFAEHGISANRIKPYGKLPRKEFLALHGLVDIALDPFPFHGTTTTCHSLWMGLPVITLAGATHASRVGVTMLTSVGLPELIARTEDEYCKIALGLAGDLGKLAQLRGSMRDRMLSSPLTDSARFARHLDAAYRTIWRDWCKQQSPST